MSLPNALNAINNAENTGKRQVLIHPSSKVIVKFDSSSPLCKRSIGEFEQVDDHRSGKIIVQLNGRINKAGVISPRYNVPLSQLEKWVVKLLPARQFGYVILTTSAGIMDHEEARRRHVSGKIIGFFY
ncbi:ribosomal protein S8 [Nemania serpens]|nr:ribosomal protein S8 [Nemania serpens]